MYLTFGWARKNTHQNCQVHAAPEGPLRGGRGIAGGPRTPTNSFQTAEIGSPGDGWGAVAPNMREKKQGTISTFLCVSVFVSVRICVCVCCSARVRLRPLVIVFRTFKFPEILEFLDVLDC